MDLKQDVLKSLLDPLARLDHADTALDAYTKISDRHDEFDEVDPKISSYELAEPDRKGDVLLPLVHSQGDENYAYGALAHAFRTRGYRPVIPVCYDDLPLCLRKQNERDSLGTCELCHHSTTAFLEALNLDPLYFPDIFGSSYTPPDPETWDDVHSIVYRGVDVSNYARATLRRYLTRRILDDDDPVVYDQYIRFLEAGLLLVDLAYELHERYELDATVGQHVPYLYGGVLLEVSRLHGVPSISFEAGYYRQGTFLFGNVKNKIGFPAFTDMESLRERVDTPLREPERRRIHQTMEARFEGEIVADNYNYTKETGGTVQVSEDETLIGVFTNLLWDASLVGADIAFDDPFSWVIDTLEYFAGRNDVTLVVKPHPAEAHRNTDDKMAEWLHENVDLPENVVVLPADTDVDPYQLMQDIDVGIVYNSTLGLEMAFDGVPVIVVAETHYRDLGFTFDANSADEYRNLLERVESLSIDEDMQDRARRYAYHLFEDRMIEVPFLTDDARHPMSVISHEQLAPGAEPFDSIVDQILRDEQSITFSGDQQSSR